MLVNMAGTNAACTPTGVSRVFQLDGESDPCCPGHVCSGSSPSATGMCIATKNGGCFPGDAQVIVRGRGSISISQLHLGNQVLSVWRRTFTYNEVFLSGRYDAIATYPIVSVTIAQGYFSRSLKGSEFVVNGVGATRTASASALSDCVLDAVKPRAFLYDLPGVYQIMLKLLGYCEANLAPARLSLKFGHPQAMAY